MNYFLENMIKGLDDDEIEFLDLVDRSKLAADRRKNIEEEQELNDYRNRVADLQEKVLEEKLQVTISKPKTVLGSKSSQTKLLKGAVVKKEETKKRKVSETDENTKGTNERDLKNPKLDNGVQEIETADSNTKNVGLTCIGILPGLGCYNDSSSDDASSDSECDTDNEQTDLIGRVVTKKDKDT